MSIYGIDLGTTYSCIARMNNKGEVEVLKNSNGHNITPSVVEFESLENIIVGETAKGNASVNPENVVPFIKRSMGSDYRFKFQNKEFSPEEISSYILKKLALDAGVATGEEAKDVVITVPAYFGDKERKATKNAGLIAGLNVLDIINEPTAAAIAYGIDKDNQDKMVLVYDLGGGTFDITMLEIHNGNITVICTNGNHSLGGKDWDESLLSYIGHKFSEQTGVSIDDFYADSELQAELMIKVEEVKKQLTDRNSAKIKFKLNSHKFEIEITRDLFDSITEDNLALTIDLTKEVLEQASKKVSSKGIPCDKFDEFILVGGSTRMKQIESEIKRVFNVEPKGFGQDESVAKGAAIYGYYLDKGKKGQDDDSLSKPVTITNVTSKSYGTDAYINDVLMISNCILMNTEIPCSTVETFVTRNGRGGRLPIAIYESSSPEQEISLDYGTLLIEGTLDLPNDLPAGSPIDFTFNIDKSGMLTVIAVERSKKRECKLVVETKAGDLSSNDVAKLAKEATLIKIQ